MLSAQGGKAKSRCFLLIVLVDFHDISRRLVLEKSLTSGFCIEYAFRNLSDSRPTVATLVGDGQ